MDKLHNDNVENQSKKTSSIGWNREQSEQTQRNQDLQSLRKIIFVSMPDPPVPSKVPMSITIAKPFVP